jgi:cytidine deaminase
VRWDEEIADLDKQYRKIAIRASRAAKKAYAPYSKLKVGAALRLTSPQLPKKNRIVTAVTVENENMGQSVCAERNAIFRAVAEFGPAIEWDLLAVVARSTLLESGQEHTIAPCGACRDVLSEFQRSSKARVIFLDSGEFVAKPMKKLHPYPFEIDTFS